jgi:cell division protein FtsL
MDDAEKQPRLGRLTSKIRLGNVVAVAIVVAMLVWVWATIIALNRNYDLERQVAQGRLENEVQEIENENLKLQQVYYGTNEYLELSAREKLNKALPGENLVILPKTAGPEKVATGVAARPVDDRSNFEKWLDFLLGAH